MSLFGMFLKTEEQQKKEIIKSLKQNIKSKKVRDLINKEMNKK